MARKTTSCRESPRDKPLVRLCNTIGVECLRFSKQNRRKEGGGALSPTSADDYTMDGTEDVDVRIDDADAYAAQQQSNNSTEDAQVS